MNTGFAESKYESYRFFYEGYRYIYEGYRKKYESYRCIYYKNTKNYLFRVVWIV